MNENVFCNFKNKHVNESAILFGSGPTIEKYNINSKAIKVGLNEMIYLNLNLDYWFMGDTTPKYPNRYLNHKNDYNNYKPNIQKFIRNQTWSNKGKMDTNIKHALYYNCDLGGDPNKCLFKKDIGIGNLIGVASITFEALQFILYTGVNKIYLIGHDCNYSNGTFRTKMKCKPHVENSIIKYWKLVKDWVKINYPNVDIYSINPVSLNIFEEKTINDIDG